MAGTEWFVVEEELDVVLAIVVFAGGRNHFVADRVIAMCGLDEFL